MNKRTKKDFLTASVFLAIFVIFTVLLRFVDKDSLAPDGSTVGFAFINRPVALRFSFHPFFYRLTKMLGFFAVALASGFALLGAYQWILRKKLFLVDPDILCLGVLFAFTVGFYILFEVIGINVRPVLLNGEAENSYPSSHTVLSVTVFAGSVPLFKKRTGTIVYTLIVSVLVSMMFLTVIGRFLSGVHWLTDLIGGLFLSVSLLFFYSGLLKLTDERMP